PEPVVSDIDVDGAGLRQHDRIHVQRHRLQGVCEPSTRVAQLPNQRERCRVLADPGGRPDTDNPDSQSSISLYTSIAASATRIALRRVRYGPNSAKPSSKKGIGPSTIHRNRRRRYTL